VHSSWERKSPIREKLPFRITIVNEGVQKVGEGLPREALLHLGGGEIDSLGGGERYVVKGVLSAILGGSLSGVSERPDNLLSDPL